MTQDYAVYLGIPVSGARQALQSLTCLINARMGTRQFQVDTRPCRELAFFTARSVHFLGSISAML